MENIVNENEAKKDRKKRSVLPKVLDLLLRVCHIGTASVLFGGVIWAVPFTQLSAWHHLTIITGCSQIILNIVRSRHWPYQIRGLAAALHIGVVGLVHLRPDHAAQLLTTALAVGIVGSHMPGALRHWSLVHRRRID